MATAYTIATGRWRAALHIVELPVVSDRITLRLAIEAALTCRRCAVIDVSHREIARERTGTGNDTARERRARAHPQLARVGDIDAAANGEIEIIRTVADLQNGTCRHVQVAIDRAGLWHAIVGAQRHETILGDQSGVRPVTRDVVPQLGVGTR